MFENKFHITHLYAGDDPLVSGFISSCPYYFRHLDWRLPVDWLGSQPVLLASYKESPAAIMMCPYIHDSQVWIRSFAAQAVHSMQSAWSMLLDVARMDLIASHATDLFSISLNPWYQELLVSSGFTEVDRVVVLEKTMPGERPESGFSNGCTLERIQPLELTDVWELDQKCFSPLWQMSYEDILTAYHLSDNCAAIHTEDGLLIGYQICNTLPTGGHLARIAVHPDYQGRGLSKCLMTDLVDNYNATGVKRLTVNTQQSNQVAIRLYESYGFALNGEEYPVYRLGL